MHDLRLALRSLRNRPMFTVIATITLALGIGATTTLFTIVNAVLLRPLPYPEASRIVSVSESQNGEDGQVVSAPDYFHWLEASRSFTGLAMYGGTNRVVTGRGLPARVDGESVSAQFFSVFGAHPALGRVFRADEDLPSGPRVVVLGHDLWQRRFAADSAIVGQSITLDAHPYTVVGVMPAGFSAPRASQYWVPMQMDPVPQNGVTYFAQVVGRLRPGVRAEDARTELSGLIAHQKAEAVVVGAPPSGHVGAVVMTLHDRMFRATRPALLLLSGAVVFLLLIACVNVANLLLARAASRQREFAVRVALGATRWRLARQLLLESVVVSALGGALGLLIPIWSVAFFVRISPASVARVDHIHVDVAVLAFAAALSLLTGLVFGLVPAFGATRADTFQSLKEGSTRTTGSTVQHRIRRGLVVLELGTALVLLTGAGLLTKSFARAMAVDTGFRADHALTIPMGLSRSAYPTDSVATRFYEQFAATIRALPGVESVGYTDLPLNAGYRMTMRVAVAPTNTLSPPISIARVSSGYMKAFGLELVAGRLLNTGDRAGAAPVVVLSAAAAHALFPGGSAIGQTIPPAALGSGRQTVVGVVKDLRELGSDTPRLPQIYQSIDQTSDFPYALVVRYTGDPAPLTAAIRRLGADLNPLEVTWSVTPVQEVLERSVAPRRFNSLIINVFAGLALVLASVGLYGVMAFQVAQRTRELGIRMALGADRARVLRFVLRDGMGLALLGTVCGLALSLGLSRFLAGMLFDVTPRDLSTFVAVPAALILVTLVACYLPARRATKVDPMVALRYE